MGKTRKNNKYRKRNNIASRKQGKTNFLKGLRGGAIDRLPVPDNYNDFLNLWKYLSGFPDGTINRILPFIKVSYKAPRR